MRIRRTNLTVRSDTKDVHSLTHGRIRPLQPVREIYHSHTSPDITDWLEPTHRGGRRGKQHHARDGRRHGGHMHRSEEHNDVVPVHALGGAWQRAELPLNRRSPLLRALTNGRFKQDGSAGVPRFCNLAHHRSLCCSDRSAVSARRPAGKDERI